MQIKNDEFNLDAQEKMSSILSCYTSFDIIPMFLRFLSQSETVLRKFNYTKSPFVSHETSNNHIKMYQKVCWLKPCLCYAKGVISY